MRTTARLGLGRIASDSAVPAMQGLNPAKAVIFDETTQP